MFNKLKIGGPIERRCQTGKITAKRVLEDCPTFAGQRKLFCPTSAPFVVKLFCDVGNRTKVTAFFPNIQVVV